jgi:predicted nucleic acid-binding protein
MPRYFVDSWFFIALLDSADSHHSRAIRLSERVHGSALVTHDAVLTEVLAFFSDDGTQIRTTAATAVRRALSRFNVLPADRALFLRALDRYERRLDKEYSLVDCMSMVVMEDHQIQHVLTNDHHFAQAGFVVVSE